MTSISKPGGFRLISAALICFVLFGCAALLAPCAQAQTFSVIYSFTDGRDGANPEAGVSLDRAGNLYGTTTTGGNDQFGTVYELKRSGPGWIVSPLYSFTNGDDGNTPTARVVFGSNGTLYGTTHSGTVYNLRPPAAFCRTVICPWSLTVLADDLRSPGYGDLTFDSSGNIYGTTINGGANGYGEVFELSPGSGGYIETALYSFDYHTTGANPQNGVVFDQQGRLYGTLYQGGPTSCDDDGTVFQLTPHGSSWTEATLYCFAARLDGASPYSGVTFDSSYNLFGATSFDGLLGSGTIFEMAPFNQWNYSVLYPFGDGDGPRTSLTIDAAGNLYGTTYSSGAHRYGSIFEMQRGSDGSYTYVDLYDFTCGDDGGYPISNVSLDSQGNLYGTASECGANNQGTVWKVTR